jgi:hypothetical protein
MRHFYVNKSQTMIRELIEEEETVENADIEFKR